MSADSKAKAKRRRQRIPKAQRRALLRTLAGAVAAVVAIRAFWGRKTKPGPALGKIQITPTCVGCTGCIAVCPTAAIEAIPDGIAVIDELCISCAYCQAGCPVDGIWVLRGRDEAA